MSTLIHPHLAPTRDTSEPSPLAVRPPSGALVRLVVVVASAVLGGIAADALLGDPGAQSAVVNAATGSAGAVVVTLTAYLFVRRMHRTLALSDVMLGSTLTLLPAASAVGVVMPALLPGVDRAHLQMTAPMATGVVAALGLAAAAVAGSRTLRGGRRTDYVYVAMLVSGALVVAGAALLADDAPSSAPRLRATTRSSRGSALLPGSPPRRISRTRCSHGRPVEHSSASRRGSRCSSGADATSNGRTGATPRTPCSTSAGGWRASCTTV
jgi:hypothetical protein